MSGWVESLAIDLWRWRPAATRAKGSNACRRRSPRLARRNGAADPGWKVRTKRKTGGKLTTLLTTLIGAAATCLNVRHDHILKPGDAPSAPESFPILWWLATRSYPLPSCNKPTRTIIVKLSIQSAIQGRLSDKTRWNQLRENLSRANSQWSQTARAGVPIKQICLTRADRNLDSNVLRVRIDRLAPTTMMPVRVRG